MSQLRSDPPVLGSAKEVAGSGVAGASPEGVVA